MYEPLKNLSDIERTKISMRAFNLMYYVTHPEVFEKIKNQKIEIVEMNELKPGQELFEEQTRNGAREIRYSYLHPVYGLFTTMEVFSDCDPEFCIKLELRKRKSFWIKQKKETE